MLSAGTSTMLSAGTSTKLSTGFGKVSGKRYFIIDYILSVGSRKLFQSASTHGLQIGINATLGLLFNAWRNFGKVFPPINVSEIDIYPATRRPDQTI
jgi:hypothetical protein